MVVLCACVCVCVWAGGGGGGGGCPCGALSSIPNVVFGLVPVQAIPAALPLGRYS